MTRARWPWLFQLLVLIAVIPLALIFAYAHRPGDFAGYLLVGELGLSGRDIYAGVPANTWPPFFGLLCIPLAWLGRISGFGTSVFWLLLNWAALLSAIYVINVMVCGQRPDFGSKVVLLPLLFSAFWIINTFEWLQVNILIFTMTLYGLLLHARRRDGLAGVLIGAAAAMKVMPILFVPYFAWRRQWRAAAFTTLFAAAWSVLPSIRYGWRGFTAQFATWLHVVGGGWGAGKRNFSVFAMFDRIIGHGFVPFLHPGSNDIAASGSPLVTLAVIIALALVAFAGITIFRGPYEPRSRAVVAEWSAVFLVASLFGTVAWRHYLVVLLLPMTLFVATWLDPVVDPTFRHKLKIVTWIAFAMGIATASDLTGHALATRLEMGSLLTMMALLLLGTLFWYRVRIERVSGAG
jgi:hypothetical protein